METGCRCSAYAAQGGENSPVEAFCPNCGDYARGAYLCGTCHRTRARHGCSRCQPHVPWRFGDDWLCPYCRIELGILERLS